MCINTSKNIGGQGEKIRLYFQLWAKVIVCIPLFNYQIDFVEYVLSSWCQGYLFL